MGRKAERGGNVPGVHPHTLLALCVLWSCRPLTLVLREAFRTPAQSQPGSLKPRSIFYLHHSEILPCEWQEKIHWTRSLGQRCSWLAGRQKGGEASHRVTRHPSRTRLCGAHEECLYTLPCTTGTGQHSLQVSAQVTVCRRHWDMFPESLVVTHTELLGAEN